MKNLGNVAILFVCVVLLIGAFLFTVDEIGLCFFGLKWPLHCVLNHLFGVRCVFCGMTRSFVAMAHGDLSAAVAYHHVGPGLFLFVVFQIPYRIWALAISPKHIAPVARRVHAAAAALVLTAMLGDWLIYLGGRFL
jgi:hypothetical protein